MSSSSAEADKRKIIIIDDEVGIREIISEALECLNYEIRSFGTAVEALAEMRRTHYDVAVCDIMMPQMTGLDFLYRAQTELILTPFVFITGQPDAQKMLEAIRLGAIDFMEKPFNLNEVREVVLKAVEIGLRKRRIRESLGQDNSDVSKRVMKDEKMITLLRVANGKKRAS